MASTRPITSVFKEIENLFPESTKFEGKDADIINYNKQRSLLLKHLNETKEALIQSEKRRGPLVKSEAKDTVLSSLPDAAPSSPSSEGDNDDYQQLENPELKEAETLCTLLSILQTNLTSNKNFNIQQPIREYLEKLKAKNKTEYGPILFRFAIMAITTLIASYLLSCVLLPVWAAFLTSGILTVAGFSAKQENKVFAGIAMLMGIYSGYNLFTYELTKLTAALTSTALTSLIAGIGIWIYRDNTVNIMDSTSHRLFKSAGLGSAIYNLEEKALQAAETTLTTLKTLELKSPTP